MSAMLEGLNMAVCIVAYSLYTKAQGSRAFVGASKYAIIIT